MIPLLTALLLALIGLVQPGPRVRLRRGEVIIRTRLINVGAGPDRAKLADLNRWAQDGTDVIGGQEFGDRLALVKAFLADNPTWRVLWETTSNNTRKTPILYNDATLRLVYWQQVVAFLGGLWLGTKGAGPDRAETKRINQARFVVRANGRRFVFLNTHMIVSAFSTSGTEGTRRKRLFVVQATAFMRAAAGWAKRYVTIGGADWNAVEDNPTLDAVRREHCPDWEWDGDADQGTHGEGGREIDQLGHVPDPRVRLVAYDVEETHGSRENDDHRSPRADYALSATRAWLLRNTVARALAVKGAR